ncbi:hypothetical protein M9H77_15800 [Catharanthus roseus]|uniref:Uncharacterized protein n=1 Tax=Catharanthus roseus TaxID=4058 RepID=A0ACC0AZP3_CATRO|nr:hypothetical protein M9H77_15800 [Catharanthus roseus]
MASNAAVPFWRAAGMTYITYSNLCANMVRNCLKEPHRSEALSREKVHFSVSKWVDGKPQKPILLSPRTLSNEAKPAQIVKAEKPPTPQCIRNALAAAGCTR